MNLSPRIQEGVGNAGCPMHPQPRVQMIKAHERSHYRSTGNTRHSRTRMVLTAYSVLSPATNSSCHRHPRIKADRTRSGRFRLRELDTSNGCQDHTALPYATRLRQEASPGLVPVRRSFSEGGSCISRRRACCRSRETRPAKRHARNAAASTASHPTFVTMANAPLSGETAEVLEVICPTG
jgi:hypothetical protein